MPAKAEDHWSSEVGLQDGFACCDFILIYGVGVSEHSFFCSEAGYEGFGVVGCEAR